VKGADGQWRTSRKLVRIIASADTSIGPPQSATTDVGQRPAFVPPGRERGQARPQGMDSARATAQFPVPVLKPGVTIEEITRLVGHGSVSVTERVYRKELRPVITRGARAINELFDGDAKG
jgi:hypothetical protein